MILGIYVLYISFKSPIIDIDAERFDAEWVIKSFAYSDWANLYNIKVGDIIIEVDNESLNEINNSSQYSIRSANTIVLKDNLGSLKVIQVKHSELPHQFLYYSLFPLIYFLANLILGIYLYVHKLKFFTSLNIFIYFIFTVSITYSSAGASTRLDSLGILINSNGLILCLILLIIFLRNYFISHLSWSAFRNIIPFYGLYGIVFFLTLLDIYYPIFYEYTTIFILSVFCILLMYIIFMLGKAYIRFHTPNIILLFWCLITPFLPFLFLYVLPEFLFNMYIISASSCALFLLLIPISLIAVQLPERLFDIDYQISRFRYYGLFSIILSSWICTGIYFLISVKLNDLPLLFLFLLISIMTVFYIKEKIDYTNRKVIYSPKNDYIHLVYKTIQRIGKVVNVEDLLNRFTQELSQQLKIDDLNIYIYSISDKSFIEKEPYANQKINFSIVEKLGLGDIKRSDNVYIGCLHQTLDEKYIFTIGDGSSIHLKKEELIYLELLIIYTSNFIENTQLIENLINEFNMTQKYGRNYPPWLSKFVWLQLENEKKQLAQELHDTILQEQIHLIRELDNIMSKQEIKEIKQNLKETHEYLIDVNNNLRFYCEKMKPPLLDTLGLSAALNKLFLQVNKHAKFTLIHSIETINLDNEFPLLIYRVIQEILNNSIKHSQATYVKIELISIQEGFEILYFDNGIGCDLSQIFEKESMGLKGMEQRVHAYNGFINIESFPNEGMEIQIKIKEGYIND